MIILAQSTIGAHSQIDIICNIHGIFTCEANNHVRGSGCPKCGLVKIKSYETFGGSGIYNNTRINRNDLNFDSILYIMYIYNDEESFYKVGISKNPQKRRTSIIRDSNYKYEIKIIFTKSGNIKDIFNLEQKIIFNNEKYCPQYKFGGYTECIKNNPIITDMELTSHVE